MIMNGCLDLVITDHRPINVLSGAGLHSLLSTFGRLVIKYNGVHDHPSEILPSERAVSDRIEKQCKFIKNKLKLSLSKIFGCAGTGGALCLDLWTDDYKKKTYMGIVAHYIDEDFRIQVRLLATSPLDDEVQYTGTYLHTVLEKVLKEYDMKPDYEQITYVTDRGGNVIKALENYNRINDPAHFIHNTMQRVFSTGRPNQIMNICENMVKYFKQSGRNRVFKITLKSKNETRWNSVLTMMESIKINWQTIDTELKTANRLDLVEHLRLLELNQMIAFLEPFRAATKKFEIRKEPSLHWNCIMFKILTSHLEDKCDDSPIVYEAKENCCRYFLETMIDSNMTKLVHKVALFLHPSFKKLNKMTIFEKDEIIDEVIISSLNC